MADEGNGERKAVTSTLTLTFEHDTFRLDIKGDGSSLDVFMTMLDQAKRYFEMQLRAQAALQMQEQIADKVRTGRILDRVASKFS